MGLLKTFEGCEIKSDKRLVVLNITLESVEKHCP